MNASGQKWVVDEFMDILREKPDSAIEKEELRWDRKVKTFASKKEAIDFLVQRANERVAKAKKALLREQNRLKRCEKLVSQAGNSFAAME